MKTILCALCAFCVFTVSAPSASSAQGIDLLRLQVLLDRAGFSPGEIDGRAGTNTQRAVEAYATDRKLDALDHAAVLRKLSDEQADAPAVVTYAITAEDANGPFNSEVPADLMQQASLPALGYRTPIEALSEKFHASPALLARLNRGARFVEGEELRVPNVVRDPAGRKAGRSDAKEPALPEGTSGRTEGGGVTVRVSSHQSSLQVIAEDGSILFHAPVTSGSEMDPLPVGEWKVTAVARNPTFNYNPDLFWDADPSHAKAKIKPGPNNPVGTVWIDIDKPHYGLHGSPEPSRIGKTESHGCVRLTNWDAQKLASLVRPGTRVIFGP